MPSSQPIHIIKSTGETVEYNRDKIRASILRTGATPEVAERVVQKVDGKVKDGMGTRHLLAIIKKELRREAYGLAQRYNLRTALQKLGPSGFKFEQYVASILKAYQYDAMIPDQELQGLCVNHEIDIIANKQGRCTIIEAKFRNRFEDKVTLKDVMATWARFMDIVDGKRAGSKCPHVDEIWIVTNGKFSDRALQYGLCKGINLIGWGTDSSLARLVDHAALYPITVIDGLRQWELDRFAGRGLMLCREVSDKDPVKLASAVELPLERVKRIVEQCRAVLEGA